MDIGCRARSHGAHGVNAASFLPFHVQEGDDLQHTRLSALVRQLKEGGRPLLCIDMGSTPRMGLLPDPARFVATLRQALEAAGCCGLLLTADYKSWGALEFQNSLLCHNL